MQINKTETNKCVTVDTKAQKELDITKREAKVLSSVVTELPRRLDRLEGPGSAGSDRRPLVSGSSDDGRGPGPGRGRPAPLAEPVGRFTCPSGAAAIVSVMSG